MGAATRLLVCFGTAEVGQLTADESGRFSFAYSPRWLARDGRFPISLSLPLQAEPYLERGHAYFANLLPEGQARDAVCARLGISPGNDFSLLRAIGGECAGALSIVDEEAGPGSSADSEYELLDDRRLQSLLDRQRVVPLLVGGPSTRLSLAGAQNKVPVGVFEGRVHLPLAGAPSTHILKLPHAELAHVPINEAFVLTLARETGLDVVRAELTARTEPPSLLVERYDRFPSDDPWPVVRWHQEDLCQALGLPSTRKYEQDRGPTLASAIEVIRASSQEPLVDVRRVIEWQAFNVCAGNADGHGKNLSILYAPTGARLAPFYDLLATRQYDRLDRRLAMGVGGQRDPDRLRARDWEDQAKASGLGARVVIGLADAIAERCADTVATVAKDFAAQPGATSVLQTLPKAIARRAQRLRRALATR